MSISEQEEKLFAEWEKGKEYFVRDGVVCEKTYQASTPMVAFVLKEYGDPDNLHKVEEKFDLRNEELKTPHGNTWWKVAKILHEIRLMDDPVKKEHLNCDMHPSVCVFNLDKEGGHKSTDMTVLALRAMKDAHFIRRQFEIYDPDLTLCGGTFDVFRYLLGHEYINLEETKGHVQWYARNTGKYVVGIKHPADFGRGSQSWEEVLDAIREICYQSAGEGKYNWK